MVRAAIYARISSDRDGDQLGVRRQIKDCEQLLARKRWKLAECYVDDDVSAYGGRTRPAYRRMTTEFLHPTAPRHRIGHVYHRDGTHS